MGDSNFALAMSTTSCQDAAQSYTFVRWCQTNDYQSSDDVT